MATPVSLSALNTDVMIGSKKVVYNQTAVVDIPVMKAERYSESEC